MFFVDQPVKFHFFLLCKVLCLQGSRIVQIHIGPLWWPWIMAVVPKGERVPTKHDPQWASTLRVRSVRLCPPHWSDFHDASADLTVDATMSWETSGPHCCGMTVKTPEVSSPKMLWVLRTSHQFCESVQRKTICISNAKVPFWKTAGCRMLLQREKLHKACAIVSRLEHRNPINK